MFRIPVVNFLMLLRMLVEKLSTPGNTECSPPRSMRAELRPGKVGTDLIVHGDVAVGGRQPAEKFFRVLRGHDVVDGEEVKAAVTAEEQLPVAPPRYQRSWP